MRLALWHSQRLHELDSANPFNIFSLPGEVLVGRVHQAGDQRLARSLMICALNTDAHSPDIC